jgi:hypothetical protein
MIELIYLYFFTTIGYIILYIQYTFIEREYIIYRKGIQNTLIKINTKFDVFEPYEIDHIGLMNTALDKIKLE